MAHKSVFLDRDGVINKVLLRDGEPTAPRRFAEFEIEAGVEQALGRLRRAGYRLFVVTNQPEVAIGELSPAVLDAMHERLTRDTGVDAIYVCPHVDADGCECRKPLPGLLRRAAAEWSVDLAASFLVGDRWRDIGAGAAAGCTTVLLEGSTEPGGEPDFRAATLADAVTIILGGSER